MMSSMKALAGVAIVGLAIALSGCAPDVRPVDCELPKFECFTKHAIDSMAVVRSNIAHWSTANLICQLALALLSIVAAIMIALQGEENKKWTRPIALLATTLVTGLTSALVTFHPLENVDKLVDVVEKMAKVINNFAYQVEQLKAGRSEDAVAKAYGSDAKFRSKATEITIKFVSDFNSAKLELLRLDGSAGRLNSVSSAPTEAAKSPPAGQTSAKK
jgi:hypothetical protein